MLSSEVFTIESRLKPIGPTVSYEPKLGEEVFRRAADYRKNPSSPELLTNSPDCFSKTLDAPLHPSHRMWLTYVLRDMDTLYLLHSNRPHEEVSVPYFSTELPNFDQLWLITQIRNACLASLNKTSKGIRLGRMAGYFLGGPRPRYPLRELAVKDYLETVRHIMTPVKLDDLPNDDPSDLECPICKVPFGEADGEGEDHDGHVQPEHPVRLPCLHVFGSACIEQWACKDARFLCPYCRANHTREIGLRGQVKLLDVPRIYASTPWWIRMLKGS
jgi:hypothetical protein